jgi:hypothetical protein
MRRFPVLAIVMTLMIACGGDNNQSSDAADDAAEDVIEEVTNGETPEVDSCTLITSEEASEAAGEELEASEDNPLGCPFTVPGETLAEFTIRGYRGSGDAMAAGEELVPDAAQVISVDGVGDDAIIISSNAEVVDFIIARDGDLFVLMNTTFLLVEPGTPEADKLTQLAALALERLVEAS